MSLVEREAVLEKLDHLFEESIAGRGAIVVASGPTASGKTALLHAFAERAAASGAAFLSATGSHAERHLPYGVVQQLLHNAALEPADAGRMAWLNETGTANRADANLEHDLCLALLDLARRQPVLIGIDDVDKADEPSFQCLLYLVRRMRSARVMVVLTETAGMPGAHPYFHAELFRHPRCNRVRVPLLTGAGVATLISRELGPAATPEMAAAGYAISGGNPLLARALVEDVRVTSGAGGPDPLPVGAAFSQGILTCLYRCDPAIVRVAHAVAVLNEAGSAATVARLADLEPQVATQHINALTMAGLLDAEGFRHPAARAAVLDFIAIEDRADIHSRAAVLLHAEGAPSRAVAEQLVAAGRTAEPWAVGMLEEASEQALADGEPQAAVEYLRLAYASCPEERRAGFGARLASASSRGNPAVAVRHLPDMVAAACDGRLGSPHAMVPVRLLLWEGRVDEALDILERLAGRADHLHTRTAAEMRAALVQAAYTYPSRSSRIDAIAAAPAGPEAAILVAPHVPAADAVADTLRRGAGDSVVEGGEHILQASSLNDSTVGLIWVVLDALVRAGRISAAATWASRLRKEAAERDAPAWQALFAAVQAQVAIRQGLMGVAEEHARAALDLLPRQGWGVAVGAPLASLVVAMTAMGRHDEAAELLSQPVPESTFETPYGLLYLQARGHHYLATNRARAALGDFDACGSLMREWDLDLPAVVPWRSDSAQALVQLGWPGRARQLLEQQLEIAGDDPRARGMSLRLLAVTVGLRQRPDLLAEAVDAFQQCGDRLHLAYALASLGRAHRTLGDTAQANALGRQAHYAARECQAEPLRQWITTELSRRRADVRPEQPKPPEPAASLSDAEQRVAALAAVGLTNREIARKLYITVSTVEQHLTRVYRKLKVNRRVDLRGELSLDLLETA
jgi:DNA-binding CsgD family transcriptional regulator